MDNNIEVSIFRYDPAVDFGPRFERFGVPSRQGITVLEVLKYVYDHYAPIAFRYGCRIKVCGYCAVMMNGNPILACKEKAQPVMTLEPLPVLPVIKDLVVDFDAYQEKRVKMRPFIERTKPTSEMPRSLSYETVSKYRECELCIRCLMCDAACPVLRKSPQSFAGPSLLLEVARFFREPQDEGDRVRLAISEGLFHCDLCGKCTEVCPAGIRIDQILKELQKAAESKPKASAIR